MKKTKEWLILNAVYSWLYHYRDQEDAIMLKHQYEELHKELYSAFIKNDSPVQKRGRPAKRQRTQKTTSTAVSKTESKDA